MQQPDTEIVSINTVFNDREYIVPKFQRPYSWNESDCAKMLSDLTSFYDSLDDSKKDQRYFLGNVILYPEKVDVWNVIDGQQRLTTLLMLMRALYEKAGVDQNEFLKRRIYKVDQSKDKLSEEVRLESRVQPEDKRNDRDDLRKTMAHDFGDMDKKNPFKVNYACIKDNLDEWWAKNDGKRDGFISFLTNNVMLLLIKCKTSDNALTLFETINNRGKQLDDADIFKAKIYGAAGEKGRDEFVERWNDITDHVWYFHIYMHILKAKEAAATGKPQGRSKMRDYILNEFEKSPLEKKWKSVMESLELLHHFDAVKGNWTNDKVFSAKESVYWAILGKFPNDEWVYPLFGFMHKYAEIQSGELILHGNKKKEYFALLESSVRFFFMKGFVHKTIEAVRTPSHKTSMNIEKGKIRPSYVSEMKKDELVQFEHTLKNSSDYGRYTKGLVFLSSFLNKRQQEDDAVVLYAKAIYGKIHLEHILPKKWCNYDSWNKVSHENNVEKLGNLMPLERALNITASNEFFARKKKDHYSKSDIMDALELFEEGPDHWYSDDLDKRHHESITRLMAFFRS